MKTASKLRPPFKCHGGKSYLWPWVVAQFPPGFEGLTYLEPFAGGASVTLNKPRSAAEALNDLDPNVMCIYRAIRDRTDGFLERLRAIPYTEKSFCCARDAGAAGDEMDRAVNEYVRRRMSRGGLGRNFGWSDRLRGGQPGDLNAWETMLETLPAIAERLRGVHLFNRPADRVIALYDHATTLVYVDPPYLPETRVSRQAYSVELTSEDHIGLAQVLRRFTGAVVVSGYPSDLYSALYRGWRRVEKAVANHASQARKKQPKVEVLWMNY